MMRHPLLPIAAAFAAGIGTAPHFYLIAGEQVLFITLCVFGAALLLRVKHYAYGLLVCWLGFFLCGTFLAAEEHAVSGWGDVDPSARGAGLRLDQPAQLVGWARTPSQRGTGGEVFDLEVTEVRQGGRSLPAPGAIRLYYFHDPEKPHVLAITAGTSLSVAVDGLRQTRNYQTPGAFDWEGYMRRQGIPFTGVIREPADVQALPGEADGDWRAGIDAFRGRLLSHLDRLYPEGAVADRRAILKAMLLGAGGWLSPATKSAFQESGTYHVLVVSGWNVAALALPLFWFLSRARIPKWLGALLTAGAVVGFAFLADEEIPVVRAALMFLIYVLAQLFYREKALLNSIALAAMILLAISPSDLWDGGFQLSFVAVLVLAAVAVPLVQWTVTPYRLALRGLEGRERDRLFQPQQAQFRYDLRALLDFLCSPSRLGRRPWRWFRVGLSKGAYLPLWAAEGALFTVAMQVGFTLVTAGYFHRVTWSGIFANLLILPLASIVVPLGMAVLMASLVWWPLAELGAVPLGWSAAFLHWIAATMAQLDWLNPRVPTPPAWVSLSFLALVALIAILVARRSRWMLVPSAALICLCVILTVAPYPAQVARGRLVVTALDVGQGDCLLVTFPQGKTLLVDGGGVIPFPDSTTPRRDVGESVVSAYLWSRGIQRLDIVVLTHDHWDHFGGLMALFDNFRVGEFWIGPDPANRDMEWLRQRAAASGARIVRPRAGITRRMDGVEVQVLSPPADWEPRRVSNNDSIVLRLGYANRHILLPGDVESRMESRLVKDGLPLASEVLKVAHHGSKTSSTAAFLDRVRPRFGIVSVGAFGRFGHPHAQVLEGLRAAGIRLYRTDQDGTVTVSTDGNRMELDTFRDTLRPWPRFVP